MKLDSCKYCKCTEDCEGNFSEIYPCPNFVKYQSESLRQHD